MFWPTTNCNILHIITTFRNNHSKQEYPARGSFICHWATEHGKVLDAMRNDTLVDMSPVINLINQHDERMRNFLRDGTKTIYDKNPVKVIESLTWRIEKDSSRIQIRRKSKSLMKCPKCSACDRNRDPNNLKLHMFHHYLDYWTDTVPALDSRETVCHQCDPGKKIIGANPEGCRIALICHRAIQHDELRGALEADTTLPRNFVQELYGEQAHKPVTVLHAGQTDNSLDCQHRPDVSKERERIALEVRKREMIKTIENRKREENIKKRKLPYVGKRIKQNLQNINFDEDSDDDREWSQLHCSDSDDAGNINIQLDLHKLSRKVLPKRQVAPSKFTQDDTELE